MDHFGVEWFVRRQQIMPLSPGTRLRPDDMAACLGEGGMGQVWQATDMQLNREPSRPTSCAGAR